VKSWHFDPIQNHISWSHGGFLLLKCENFPSLMEETRLQPHQGFLKYKCELYDYNYDVSSSLTRAQCKIDLAYRTSKHRLVIKIGWWLTIPITRAHSLSLFCSYNVPYLRGNFGTSWSNN
jgi:hypothetical protein